MAERCKRSDGKGWLCCRPVAEGKGYCETHIKQAQLRQKQQLAPDHLKLKRARRALVVPKSKQESDDGVTDVAVRRSKIKAKEESECVSDVPRKRVRKIKKGDSSEGRSIVMKLKHGRMEIDPRTSSSSLQHKAGSLEVKIGAPITGFRRPIRSKNSDPVPTVVEKVVFLT
ncbi:hypothetical protein L1987_38442 [Smallanthus sonchifolius]|uniref:Uncharacterized protein n=1 Tax=Smallanthus sonchifolius TaxID=185202 RepID=A0ACB9HKD4_9ASTR|nr:hypothetical protein L1987_38442 [Smallanthus sonchifolius]